MTAETPTGAVAAPCPSPGSSEAIMIAGLAMKLRWCKWRESHGKDTARPNLVFASIGHVTIDKFCNYFGVRVLLPPLSGSRFYARLATLMMSFPGGGPTSAHHHREAVPGGRGGSRAH